MKLFLLFAIVTLLGCSYAMDVGYEPITCDGFACEVCHNGGYCIPAPLSGYMCNCPDEFTGPRCDICRIKPGWFDGGNGYQYWKTPTNMTYENAQKECEKNGAQLAVHGFRDPAFQRKLTTHFEPSVLWIGLTDRSIEGTFIWNDGIESSTAWFNWGGPVPQSDDSADCVAIANSTNTTLSFDAFDCSMEYGGYCEAPIGSHVFFPLYDTPVGLRYTIIPPASYDTSQLLCERLGGNLAVTAVNNEKLLRYALNHFQQTGHIGDFNVFLGFEDVIIEGRFVSRSGEVLSTSLFWNVDNPGPNTTNDDCLSATPEYSAWLEDVDCSVLLPGLCEIFAVPFLNERECKSGKTCPYNSVCVINDATCLEECICMEGYVGYNRSSVDFDCKYDKCYNNKITCGSNSFCAVVDHSTFEQDCVCEDGFYAIGNIHTDGCFQFCNGLTCGVDAYCVYNPEENIEECRCKPGYAPNDSPMEGCFYDLCANGNITCGDNADCCILNMTTKLQGCRCADRFVPDPDPETGCVEPCNSIICGENARCVVETNSTIGHCECIDGHLPNKTAEEGCFYDKCGNGDIECGSFAICAILCDLTQLQGCVCYNGFLPNTTAEDGCVDPCGNMSCGENARCVVDPDEVEGHCECNSGFLPNNTAADGCFYDECTDITCGEYAKCGVLCNVTKTQGCICFTGFLPNPTPEQGCVDPCANVSCGMNSNCVVPEGSATGHCQCIDGYLPSNNASEGCFQDKCTSGDIICGRNAVCGLLCEVTKLQGCMCLDGYLPNKTASNGCYYDKCGNDVITCGSNARCGLLCDVSLQQGCICINGFVPNGTVEDGGCIAPKDCTQLTAFDFYFASLPVNMSYHSEVYGVIFSNITSDFRSTQGFSLFSSIGGATAEMTPLDSAPTLMDPYNSGTQLSEVIGNIIDGQISNNRNETMNIVIIAGVAQSDISSPPSNLQDLGTSPVLNNIYLIPDTLTVDEVPSKISSIKYEICQWVLDGYPDIYA